MAYDSSLHTTTNKSIGIAQANPTDARSYFYDTAAFVYRPYNSIGEVLSYLNNATYRTGNFPVFIKTGSIVSEYAFKDGTADANLVQSADKTYVDNTSFINSIIFG